MKCDRLAPLTMDDMFAAQPSNLAHSESPCFLVAGVEPMLAFYSPAAEPFTLASAVSVAGQLGTMVASAVTSKVFGFAKSWFGGRAAGKDGGSSQSATQSAAAAAQSKKQKRIAPAPLPMPIIDLPLNRALRDATRALTRISLDPISGHYACCADSLGRVLLVESQSMLAVRMWKGYREARTAWIVQPNSPPPPQQQQQPHEPSHRPSPLSLYLLLYAPRRGLLELWAVPQGRRSAFNNAATQSERCLQLTHSTLSHSLTHFAPSRPRSVLPPVSISLCRCVRLSCVCLSLCAAQCGRSVRRLRLCAASASVCLYPFCVSARRWQRRRWRWRWCDRAELAGYRLAGRGYCELDRRYAASRYRSAR